VRGDIDFTGDSLNATNISAQFLGGPLSIDTVTRNGQVQVLARGRGNRCGMAPWLGATWGKRLRGRRPGMVKLTWSPGESVFRVESDLVDCFQFAGTLAKPQNSRYLCW